MDSPAVEKMVTVQDLWRQGRDRLRSITDTPDLEAGLLLEHATSLTRLQQITATAQSITTAQRQAFEALLTRRLAHEPVSRIIGLREFYGLSFHVTPATLDPRPDSECLIEAARHILPDTPLTLCDLGTGTGCLLITLLTLYPHAKGVALDASPEAIATARRNAERHGVANRLTCVTGSWADSQTVETLAAHGPMALLISNPPYIRRDDIATLAPDVRDYDPALALDGGADGLACYRQIAAILPALCQPGAHIILETGWDQTDDVQALMQMAGCDLQHTLQDLSGHPRGLSLLYEKPQSPHHIYG